MDIAALNIRITFQRNEVIVDKYKNHKNTWTDYYTCYATASGQNSPSMAGQEQAATVTTDVHEILDFTVRYCTELKDVEPDQYRIVANENIYNITQINQMAFKHKSLKFHCTREKR